MSKLTEAVNKMVWLQRECFANPDMWEIHYREFIPAVQKAAADDPAAAWDIFRNGTNDEFLALVDELEEIGKEFDSDASLCEIMRIGKARLRFAENKEDFLRYLQNAFGALFDHFWNETESTAETRALTFSQALQETAT